MAKTTTTYWNPISPLNKSEWTPVKGLEGMAEELTLSIDEETGEYTRLTRFLPGADTTSFGPKSHEYPEEIFVVSGRVYDEAFDMWLETGFYASRPQIKRENRRSLAAFIRKSARTDLPMILVSMHWQCIHVQHKLRLSRFRRHNSFSLTTLELSLSRRHGTSVAISEVMV
jgi:hypothetical protein